MCRENHNVQVDESVVISVNEKHLEMKKHAVQHDADARRNTTPARKVSQGGWIRGYRTYGEREEGGGALSEASQRCSGR